MTISNETTSIKNKIVDNWRKRSIKEKIHTLVSLVFVIILMSVLLDIWTIKLSLWDFRYSLAANEKAGTLVQCLENESTAFKDYTRGSLSNIEFDMYVYKSNKAVAALPTEHDRIGSERLAWTQKIAKAYDVYEEKIEEFYTLDREDDNYIEKEYEIYEMQDYLKSYSSTLLLLSTVAVNEFYQDRFPILFLFPAIILGIAIIMVVIVIRASSAMSASLVEPILKLGEASRKIATNDIFTEDIVVNNQDEIGDLVYAFNKMKYATREYIVTLEANREALDKLHTEELQKKEVENQLERMKFEVLRHQINPHFLFNTLNVISGMAVLEDAKTTDTMIKALSSLLRYNLRMEDKETTLELELNVMNDYMYLQKMRFGDRFNYEIDCDDNLLGASIPTFVLQPIVENSIVHGISHKEDGGYVRIKVEKTEGDHGTAWLNITLADTGVGMDNEELEALRKKLAESGEERKAIGVSNIYRRIKMMYPDSTIEINSTKGEGTIFKITIPYVNELEE